jgi:hypothetical protein
MVEIALNPEEYEIIEKWFGLIFGDKKAKKPKKEEIALYQKLAFMHIAEMQADIAEAEEGEE